ncbi:MAG: hypothetical protein H3C26_10125 [Rhodocyclaceae bacterium]|nr:hypothetical protein [Rhodocyclaceae bacterium]
MSACIFYTPEIYTAGGLGLMGRNAAGESLLRGFLAYSSATEFWAQVLEPEYVRHFAQTVRPFGYAEPVRTEGEGTPCG